MSGPIMSVNILYLCDRKACENCSDYCKHTSDIEHAMHKDSLDGREFEYKEGLLDVTFMEKKIETEGFEIEHL